MSPLTLGHACHCCSVAACLIVTLGHVEGDAFDWNPSEVLKLCPGLSHGVGQPLLEAKEMIMDLSADALLGLRILPLTLWGMVSIG